MTEPVEVTFTTPRKRTHVRSFSFHDGDDELIDYIQEYLGTSASESVRSAIRAFASQLASLQQRSQPGRRKGT